VLVSARGEARGLVEQTSSGLGVDPEDPQALVEAARYLRDHREAAADMGRHGRRFASTRLRSEQGSQLESVLLALAVP
jgi:glycosyltransferase involved in cell wall biosynthesis